MWQIGCSSTKKKDNRKKQFECITKVVHVFEVLEFILAWAQRVPLKNYIK